MADSIPPKDSGLFGNIFDLNGDGRTDGGELALMFMLFAEMQEEERRLQQSGERISDLDDMDIIGI